VIMGLTRCRPEILMKTTRKRKRSRRTAGRARAGRRLEHEVSRKKPPRFPSAACAVALRLRRGLPRRAVLERSPSLLTTGRKAVIE